jgi:cytochrome d ubiquinol oxidase subunit II
LGGALFGAFPVAYAVLLHALYIPVMAMIFGMILRGAAFEFREHARDKHFWNLAFAAGSLIIALAQGLTLGALLQGIPVQDREFAGGAFDWLRPFPLLVAVGVVCGYGLLGATYLILRTEGVIQARANKAARILVWLTFGVAVVVTLWTPFVYPRVLDKWFSLPGFFLIAPLPATGLLALVMLVRGLRRGAEVAPFVWTVVIFLASFGGLAVSLHPYIVPPDLTLAAAAASPPTLIFMLTGIGMLLPVMMIYNGYQYMVFRGKITSSGYHH